MRVSRCGGVRKKTWHHRPVTENIGVRLQFKIDSILYINVGNICPFRNSPSPLL